MSLEDLGFGNLNIIQDQGGMTVAYGQAFTKTSMPNISIWYGNLISYDSNKIVIDDGVRKGVYKGDFSYSYFGEVFGILESYVEYENGSKQYSVRDINADANDVYYAVQILGDAYLSHSIVLAGNDTLIGSSKGDYVRSFAGDDLVKGMNGNDKLDGGSGYDSLVGGSGNDKLFGGTEADNLKGGSGNDKLFGEEGNDILKGQGGADRFVFRAGYEQDTVKDFSDKDDVLDLRSFGLASVAEAKSYATMIDGDTVFDFGGGDLLILEDFNLSALDKGDFII
jgi:Ca2+-binding RTX toxin-like protein